MLRLRHFTNSDVKVERVRVCELANVVLEAKLRGVRDPTSLTSVLTCSSLQNVLLVSNWSLWTSMSRSLLQKLTFPSGIEPHKYCSLFTLLNICNTINGSLTLCVEVRFIFNSLRNTDDWTLFSTPLPLDWMCSPKSETAVHSQCPRLFFCFESTIYF